MSFHGWRAKDVVHLFLYDFIMNSLYLNRLLFARNNFLLDFFNYAYFKLIRYIVAFIMLSQLT